MPAFLLTRLKQILSLTVRWSNRWFEPTSRWLIPTNKKCCINYKEEGYKRFNQSFSLHWYSQKHNCLVSWSLWIVLRCWYVFTHVFFCCCPEMDWRPCPVNRFYLHRSSFHRCSISFLFNFNVPVRHLIKPIKVCGCLAKCEKVQGYKVKWSCYSSVWNINNCAL